MANYSIVKELPARGSKGDKGDTAESDTSVPINGIIGYDGADIPEGYEDIEGG